MKRCIVLFLFVAGTIHGQTIACPHAKTCLRSAEVAQIASILPVPDAWTIIPISDDAAWREMCAEYRTNCDIPAFTDLRSMRTYLNVTVIWQRSGESGIKEYLKHELGHIYTRSAKERDADRWAREH